MAKVDLTRRVSFSSGHRFWFEALSAEQNRELFGKWASPYNHGHNYVLDVTARGALEARTGMVVNIKEIDDVLQDKVVKRFGQKSINDEIDGFADRTPCLENLLLYFRDELRELPGGTELVALRLEEFPGFYGEWTVEGDQVTITRSYEFAASHRLHDEALSDEENVRIFGKCNNPNGHGHNYVLEVTVSGDPDPTTGFITDMAGIDEAVTEHVLDRYDHKHLNTDVPELVGKNPTSEVVTLEIFKLLDGKLPGTLERVRIGETPRSSFVVTRGDV
ncbi:MAG: 6-carboxytetrahydropterin synthase [Armatimonadetes bacterium]|nr:6-carboxytetrahydropterin synthase [Armatimonadota bacterium]